MCKKIHSQKNKADKQTQSKNLTIINRSKDTGKEDELIPPSSVDQSDDERHIKSIPDKGEAHTKHTQPKPIESNDTEKKTVMEDEISVIQDSLPLEESQDKVLQNF